ESSTPEEEESPKLQASNHPPPSTISFRRRLAKHATPISPSLSSPRPPSAAAANSHPGLRSFGRSGRERRS
uniref:Uncharacterized protein n=1 Tax=Oryza brachyantha TaxID=4533 RepID=J3KYM8_ORYBR